MKLILKVLALPLLFVVTLLCIIGKLVEHLSSLVVGLFLLFTGGCIVFCLIKAMWLQVAILTVSGLLGFLLLFATLWLLMQIEALQGYLGEFLHS